MKTLKLTKNEIIEELGIEPASFPTYAGPLLNLANRFSGATRPSVVGQMSELIEQCNANCLDDWQDWYLEKHPTAIAQARDLIKQKVKQFQTALSDLTDEVITEWLHDLIIVKTYQGLKVQKIILEKVADALGKPWTPSNSTDESKGIDGYINGTPVSVKPGTLETKPQLLDNLPECIIFYEKTSTGGLKVTFDETLIT